VGWRTRRCSPRVLAPTRTARPKNHRQHAPIVSMSECQSPAVASMHAGVYRHACPGARVCLCVGVTHLVLAPHIPHREADVLVLHGLHVKPCATSTHESGPDKHLKTSWLGEERVEVPPPQTPPARACAAAAPSAAYQIIAGHCEHRCVCCACDMGGAWGGTFACTTQGRA
jgi:hypothetical protein